MEKEEELGDATWNNLPADLLLIIFKKLSIEDLVSGAPLCCSSWYRASRDPSILKYGNVDLGFLQSWSFEYKKMVVDFVLRQSQGCLNSVKFPVDRDAVDLFLYLAMGSPILKSFYLEDSFDQLTERVTKVKKFNVAISKLRELEVMAINKHFICFYTLEQIRSSCPTLSTLEVIDEKAWVVKYVVSKILRDVKVLGAYEAGLDESPNFYTFPDNAASVLKFWFQCMFEVS